MKYAKFTDKQLFELSDSNMLVLSTQNVLKEIIKKFVALENTVFSGMQVRQTSTASGQVQVTAGYGVQVMPTVTGLLELPTNQIVNVLSGSPDPDNGVWGVGQVADTSGRYDIICIAYAQKTGDAQLKYFYDDQVIPPEEYQATVDTTISDWFDIKVVHGVPGGGVPATPSEYFKLAEIYIAPSTSAITDAMITDKRGSLGLDTKTAIATMTGVINAHTQIVSSEAVVGHIQLATSAETATGVINTKAVHPAGLKAELDKKISHSLASAANDFLVASGAGSFVKKTLAEVRTLLGLGDAAYKNVGTTSGTVAAGDHTHTGVYEPVITKNTAFNVSFEASTSNIKMDGTASVGTAGTVARADHVHPSDTSKISHSLASAVNDFLVASGAGSFVKKTLTETQAILGLKAAAYLDVGTTSGTVAAGNHTHTGVYEPVITKNTAFNTSFETTASNIKMDGTASVGTAATVARADHVHPSDTSKAAAVHTHAGGDITSAVASANNATYATSAGDADTVDGLHKTALVRFAALTSDDIQNNTTLESGVYITTTSGLKGASGEVVFDGLWHVMNMKYANENGYNAQLILPCTSSNVGIHVRTASGGAWSRWRELLSIGVNDNISGFFDKSSTAPTGTVRLNYSGYLYATRVYNAVYNDYAEYFERAEKTEPGDIIMLNPNGGGYVKAVGYANKLVRGVHSDSFGHIVGGNGDGHDDENFVPIGLIGRVKVKIVGKARKGQNVICSDIPGVGVAVDEYIPGAVIGQVDEDKTTDDIMRVRMFIRY